MLNTTGRLLAALLLLIGAPAPSVAQAAQPRKESTEHTRPTIKTPATAAPHANTDQAQKRETCGSQPWKDPTWWLVGVTGILAFFTYRLWSSTHELVSGGQKIANDQLALQGKQTDLLEAQKDIQRRQFFATHRPKLVVRELRVEPPIKPDTGAYVSFAIANVGASVATIIESHCVFEQTTGPFLGPLSYTDSDNALGDTSVEPGQHVPFTFRSDILFTDINAELKNAIQPSGPGARFRYLLRGFIIYSDMNDNVINPAIKRRTAFCRQLDLQRMRFVRSDDPDHEYQD